MPQPGRHSWRTPGHRSLRIHPHVLLGLALAVHLLGRASAFCAPSKFDSLVYAVASYKFYAPQADASDLVPDKPAGQALLTGWIYLVWPGPPSRLPLLLLDSIFLLAGYALFYRLARQRFGEDIAAAGTLMLVLGINAYNTQYADTAGVHVNEVYMLAPGLWAVNAWLRRSKGPGHVFLCGCGVGLALTIKQTAVVLPLAMAVVALGGALAGRSEIIGRRGRGGGTDRTRGRAEKSGLRKPATRTRTDAASSPGKFVELFVGRIVPPVCFLAGVACAWTPLLAALAARGWLYAQLHDLASYSMHHVSWPALGWPAFSKVLPLVPMIFWIGIGLVVARAWRQSDQNLAGATGTVPADARETGTFAAVWLAGEVILILALTRTSAHHFQQLVPPAALLACTCMASVRSVWQGWSAESRSAARGWALAVTLVLMGLSAMPFWAEVARRLPTFSYAAEVQEFQMWLAEWSPRRLVP